MLQVYNVTSIQFTADMHRGKVYNNVFCKLYVAGANPGGHPGARGGGGTQLYMCFLTGI